MSAPKSLNPKRATGDSLLNPKRASGSGIAGKPASSASSSTTASKSSSATTASVARRRTPLDTGLTKGVAGLRVAEAAPAADSRRGVGLAGGRRRAAADDEGKGTGSGSGPSGSSSGSSSSSSAPSGSSSLSAAKANQARPRLSITAGKEDASKLDGHVEDAEVRDPLTKVLKSMAAGGGVAAQAQSHVAPKTTAATPAPQKKRAFSHYASLSKVGFVPFNPNKVNQDRSVEIVKFGGSEEKAFFAVFDGHGALGHEVSSFLVSELPKFVLKQSNLDSAPHEALTKAFLDCNVKLASSAIDCTFSGSTAIAVYIANGKIYSCNAGDSRAVLARAVTNPATGEIKYTAIPLSSDQKPEREDEKKRILENKGRVEACKGMRGEDIGPPRVWLSHQDVPGLAMSRSFGDLIAASVGVIARPEIWERDVAPGDSFIILASDGVFEFLGNQECVDLAVAAHAQGGPEGAVKALVEESTNRWKAEEEVVDDITAVIVWL